MKFCAPLNAARQFSYWLIKALLFCWSLFYSPQKTARELFILWLQGNQSFSDKLRFRSQKGGTLMFRVAGAYVPNFFRISFETEPRLFFFLRPWLKVAAPLQLCFLYFFFFRELRQLTLNTFAGFWTWKTGQAGIFKLCQFKLFNKTIGGGEGREVFLSLYNI